MIEKDENGNITISYGDTFAITFLLSKPIEEADKAVLCIYDGDEVVITDTFSGVATDKIYFVIEADEMSELEGDTTYKYDMHIDFANGKVYTTDWKKDLRIKGVAHDVEHSNED